MGKQCRRTSWVFDYSLLRDGLFWSGLTLGILLAVWETSSIRFNEMPALVVVVVALVTAEVAQGKGQSGVLCVGLHVGFGEEGDKDMYGGDVSGSTSSGFGASIFQKKWTHGGGC